MRKLFYIKPSKRTFSFKAAMSWDEYGNPLFDYLETLTGYYTKKEANNIFQKNIKRTYSLDPLDYSIEEV